jgi:DNA primase
MALYTKTSKDRVRDTVDFVELVSTRTELRRAGPSSYEGLCPFHDERTPSFGIDPTQKVYYCFGCQASGDVFTFVEETEGVDFKGALELLADRCGIELELEEEDEEEAERRKLRERLLELLTRTTAYYERCLWESSEAKRAREYLLGRGLGEEILKEFRVGYAPSAWDRVLSASRRGGFSERELYATGLAQRSKENGQPYARFRSRIMFPLANARGRVLGFGARAMGEGQKPKYLNTSDNDIYHKGLHLYGSDLARAHATRAGQVILCEGYTDVIALHQAGMRNAVGLMGTALTGEQVSDLARMAQTVLLALDSDTAGQEAMLKASSLARKRDTKLRVVPLPEGRDPAELIQADGTEAMGAALKGAVPFERFQVERVLARGDHGNPEGKQSMIVELKPLFDDLGEGAIRMELMQMVSSRLALKENLVEQLLAEGVSTSRNDGSGAQSRGDASSGTGTLSRALSRRGDTERAFLALCIASPQEGAQALESLEVDEHFSSELLRRATRRLRDGDLREPMADDPSAPDGGLEGDPELKALLAELVVEAGREQAHPAMLEVQRLQLELASVERQLQGARGRANGDVSELAHRRTEVKREFDRANERVLEETGEREG